MPVNRINPVRSLALLTKHKPKGSGVSEARQGAINCLLIRDGKLQNIYILICNVQ